MALPVAGDEGDPLTLVGAEGDLRRGRPKGGVHLHLPGVLDDLRIVDPGATDDSYLGPVVLLHLDHTNKIPRRREKLFRVGGHAVGSHSVGVKY